ncbi:MAG: hypothetical protein ABIP54_03470, partial [Candidatus Andersenbacteria bacterium]
MKKYFFVPITVLLIINLFAPTSAFAAPPATQKVDISTKDAILVPYNSNASQLLDSETQKGNCKAVQAT